MFALFICLFVCLLLFSGVCIFAVVVVIVVFRICCCCCWFVVVCFVFVTFGGLGRGRGVSKTQKACGNTKIREEKVVWGAEEGGGTQWL